MTSKEALDALDKLEECAYAMEDLPMSNWIDLAEDAAELDLKIMDWVETIKLELLKGKQALLELKAIKDANPSEALERYHNGDVLVSKADSRYEDEYLVLEDDEEYQTIKQALLKAQEQEKVLKVIKNIVKFGDDLNSILDFDTYEEYSKHSGDYDYKLSQEEFVLLKKI